MQSVINLINNKNKSIVFNVENKSLEHISDDTKDTKMISLLNKIEICIKEIESSHNIQSNLNHINAMILSNTIEANILTFPAPNIDRENLINKHIIISIENDNNNDILELLKYVHNLNYTTLDTYITHAIKNKSINCLKLFLTSDTTKNMIKINNVRLIHMLLDSNCTKCSDMLINHIYDKNEKLSYQYAFYILVCKQEHAKYICKNILFEKIVLDGKRNYVYNINEFKFTFDIFNNVINIHSILEVLIENDMIILTREFINFVKDPPFLSTISLDSMYLIAKHHSFLDIISENGKLTLKEILNNYEIINILLNIKVNSKHDIFGFYPIRSISDIGTLLRVLKVSTFMVHNGEFKMYNHRNQLISLDSDKSVSDVKEILTLCSLYMAHININGVSLSYINNTNDDYVINSIKKD